VDVVNKSDWKGFEKLVAEALGGKRRFRTTENYGKEADDVLFPKKVRTRYPKVRQVAIECKKRKGTLNIHAFFAEAKTKYCQKGKHLIFSSKITRRGTLKKDLESYKDRIVKLYLAKYRKRKGSYFKMSSELERKLTKKALRKAKDKIAQRQIELRATHDISALVTVELEFFSELFNAWKEKGNDE
jgi:hypothetical protein